MKLKDKKWFTALVYVLYAATMIFALFVAFDNPELTRTQQFLFYWEQWTIILVAQLLFWAASNVVLEEGV